MNLNAQERKVMFALLRSALWQKPMDVQVGVGYDWTGVLKALKTHSLLGITVNSIMSLPSDRLPDESQQIDSYQHLLSLTRNHHRLNKSIVETFSMFRSAGIDAVLLKGQGLSTLYPMEFTRSCGDIDIYVGEEKYEEACQLIDGYCGEEAVKASVETTCHYEIKTGKSKFELHRKVTDSAVTSKDVVFNRWADEQLVASKCSTVKIDDSAVLVPNTAFNSLYVFDHLLRHFMSQGVGLRQFVDWTVVLHHWYKEIIVLTDNERERMYEELESRLREFGIFRAWKILGGIVVKDLGLPCEEFPFYSERTAEACHERYAEFVLNAGNMGLLLIGSGTSWIRKVLPKTFAPNFHLKHFLYCSYLLPNAVLEHIGTFFSSFMKKGKNEPLVLHSHKGAFSDPFRRIKK